MSDRGPFPAKGSLHYVNWGRTALATIVEAEGLRGGSVALPAFVCEESIEPVFDAYDLTPVFVDVSLPTLHVDHAKLRSVVDRVDAVLYVQAFGYPERLDGVRRACDRADTVLVEDCARAAGATVDGVPVGTWGHHATYSLYKLSPVAKGGVLATTAPPEDVALGRASLDLRSLVSVLPSGVRDAVSVRYPLDVERRRLDPVTRFAFERFLSEEFETSQRAARESARRLRAVLDPAGFECQPARPGRVYPSLPVLAPDERDDLVHSLRAKHVPVKVAWGHPWAKSVAGAEFDTAYPTAATVSDSVFQLRLRDMDDDDVDRAVDVLRAFATG